MPVRKQFLLLQLRPEDTTSDSEFEAIIEHGGLDPQRVDRIRLDQVALPVVDLERYCAIIVGGSPFDLSIPAADKTALQNRIEEDFDRLFDLIVPLDFPFLGACSGNGLLGSYLGASISTRYAEPVGGATVYPTKQGLSDPLLEGFPDQIRVLLGHKEACDAVPDCATLLVRGEECPVQMFRVGDNIYATQFHPEGDLKGFKVRIEAYKHHGYFDAAETNDLIRRLENEKSPYGGEILRRFVARYGGS